MYKTVRQGENSLQYTILPQTEEVLCNSGMRGKGRDYSPSVHLRRSHRRLTLQIILVLLTCVALAVVFALIPIYAIERPMLDARLRELDATATPVLPAGRDILKSRKKQLDASPDVASTLGADSDTSTLPSRTTPDTSPGAADGGPTPRWAVLALRPWKTPGSTTMLPLGSTGIDRESVPLLDSSSGLGSDVALEGFASRRPWEKDAIITPTVAPEEVTARDLPGPYSRALPGTSTPRTTVTTPGTTRAFEDVLITTKSTATVSVSTDRPEDEQRFRLNDLKDALLSVEDDEDFKESLEVDEVFSLPPLKPDMQVGDDVTVAKAGDGAWYGARWPFVDTSSYFQWTGYSPGDNLLLPLLVAALSSLTLVLLLALALRRRHRARTTAAHVGKLTADLQEDNANLLTADIAEDE